MIFITSTEMVNSYLYAEGSCTVQPEESYCGASSLEPCIISTNDAPLIRQVPHMAMLSVHWHWATRADAGDPAVRSAPGLMSITILNGDTYKKGFTYRHSSHIPHPWTMSRWVYMEKLPLLNAFGLCIANILERSLCDEWLTLSLSSVYCCYLEL